MKRFVVAGALAGGVVLVGAVGVAYAQTPTTTAKGTRVAGVSAVGLDAEALERRLQALVDTQPPTLKVRAGTRSVVLARKDLGVAVDVAGTADKVLEESGRRSLLGLITLGGGKTVEPELTVDADRLDAAVARVVKVAQMKRFDGDLGWDGAHFVVKTPTPGQSASDGDVRSALRTATGKLSSEVELKVVAQKSDASPAELEALAAKAQAGLRPVRLTAADLTSTVPVADLAPLVTVTGKAPRTLVLRKGETEALATRVAAVLSRPVQEPRFTTPPSAVLLNAKGNATWSPRPAAVTVTEPGHAGLTTTPGSVAKALTDSLRDARATATLIPTVVQPSVTASMAGRVNSLVGTFTTAFTCCQPRVQNIGLIARTVDGTVIAPGQSFSLNGVVGRRTGAKGYIEAPFILDGKLDKDIGGGVSQFATTMYNAAFFSGLRLDSHKAHSFYISRYPVGREATVNYPGIDLAWTNNTSAPVVVDAATTGTSLTVSLYGDNGGRTVSAVTGPRQPVAGKDFRITITRTVRLPGGQTTSQKISTLYAKPPEGH